jgi:hypothetical protein
MLPAALLAPGSAGPPDDGASPVVAAILFVAVAAVTAMAVYASVSGFTAGKTQAPAATFEVVGCAPADEQVSMKLTSRGPIQMDDVEVILYNGTDDTREAANDPLVADGGPWSTGELVAVDADGGSPPAWDASLESDGGLEAGSPYRLDFVHDPTSSVFSQRPFPC